MILPLADPGIASATLRTHLDQYWNNRSLDSKGWGRHDVDELHVLVEIPAGPINGSFDSYFLKLGAEYYDTYPPTVLFVEPVEGFARARPGSEWWPRFTSIPSWFQLHDQYTYHVNNVPTTVGQLVCCSVTAEYYISDHTPTESQRWCVGENTVAATLSRISEVLRPPYYEGTDAPNH